MTTQVGSHDRRGTNGRTHVCNGPEIKKLREPHSRDRVVEAAKKAVGPSRGKGDGANAYISVKSLMRAEAGDPVLWKTVEAIALGLGAVREETISPWDLLWEPERPHQVDQRLLYRSMTEAIQMEKPQILKLSSLQPLNPQDPARVEMVKYHQTLQVYLRESGARAYRILAVHSLSKLVWLHQLVAEYGVERSTDASQRTPKPPARLSIRVLDCPNDWDGHGRPVLPPIIQLIGRKVFLSDPFAHRGTEVSCVEVQSQALAELFDSYYEGLWAGCEKGAVLEDGYIQREHLNRIVYDRTSSYLQHVLESVRDLRKGEQPMSPEDLLKEVAPVLELFKGEWYCGGLVSRGRRPYGRRRVAWTEQLEVMLAYWGDEPCLPHDHGGSRGLVKLLRGEATVTDYDWNHEDSDHSHDAGDASSGELTEVGRRELSAGDIESVHLRTIHSMAPKPGTGLVTLHIYAKPITSMRVFAGQTGVRVNANCGAWWPEEHDEKLHGATPFPIRWAPQKSWQVDPTRCAGQRP